MASAEMRASAARDWAPGNPWFWITAGLLSTGLSWALAFSDMYTGGDLAPVRVPLIFLGLLAVGGAIVIRFHSARPAYLETLSRDKRRLVLGGLVLVYLALALTASFLLLLRLFGVELLWKPGSLVIIWLIVAPMSFSAASFCSRARDESRSLSDREEASALLVLAAVACVFGCFGLYAGKDRAGEWETIRLLVGVMAFLALVAAPLVVAPQPVRRGVISLLVLLHFGGICTAVLATPPTPWVISQLWTRIYRPYLEFMYLNNAYHFYSPDPGPATYVWFRLFYEDEQGKLHGEWHKIPEFDDRGFPRYGVALTYQRILALTENITYKTTPPPDREIVKDSNGEYTVKMAKYAERRYKHSPEYRPLVGEPPLAAGALIMPFHPHVPLIQQYEPPVPEVQSKLASYARHACLRPHPEHPEWRAKRVKVYRVVHLIPAIGPFAKAFIDGADPRDPEFYRPYFVGEYDSDGKLINPADPFLYWLMPIYRDSGLIRDYARRHAGDPNWIGRLTPDAKEIEWLSEKRE